MARSRNIKPGFFTDGALSKLDIYARMLFAAMWCLADREGRLLDKPEDIEMFAFPRDDVDTGALLDSLSPKFIERYEVNGVRLIQINNFGKHQNPHKNESPSELPPPHRMEDNPGDEPEQHPSNTGVALEHDPSSTVQVPEQHPSTPAGFLDSRIPGFSDSQEGTLEPHGSCAEQEKSCPTPPAPDETSFSESLECADEPVIMLPCIGKKRHGVMQEDIDHYAELYPAVDIVQQLRCMVGWLESNPTRLKKSGKGVKSFITGWLGREQNRGGAFRAGTGPPGIAARADREHKELTKNPFEDG